MTKLRQLLQPSEQAIWVGAPNPRSVFSRWDIIAIPFSAVWATLFVFMFFVRSSSDETSEAIFPSLFLVPFVALAAYAFVGRFIFKWWINRRTVYAVTDRNVLIAIYFPFSTKVRILDIGSLKGIQQDVSSSGRGTITFGDNPKNANWFANTGLNPFQSSKDLPLAFFNIADVRQVYSTIIRQRDDANREMRRLLDE